MSRFTKSIACALVFCSTIQVATAATSLQYRFAFSSGADIQPDPNPDPGPLDPVDPDPVDPGEGENPGSEPDEGKEDPANPGAPIVYGARESFIDTPFTVSWRSSSAVNYKIRSDNSLSGIPTTDTDVGTVTSQSIMSAEPGTYSFFVTSTDSDGNTKTASRSVRVEEMPMVSDFSISENEVAAGADITLSWNASPGAELQIFGVGDVTGKSSVITQAGTRSGSNNFNIMASKTLNGVDNWAMDTLTYKVVGAPLMYSSNYPALKDVFAINSSFNISWASDTAVSYTIQSDNADSGVPTTPVSLGANKSYSTTTQATGTFTYTIIGTNKFGVSTPLKVTVNAVPIPRIYSFNANKTYVSPGELVTLTWNTVGSTDTRIVGIGPVTGNSITVPADTNIGQQQWTLSINNVANGQSWGSSLAASVNVVGSPNINITQSPKTTVSANQPFYVGWEGTNLNSFSMIGSDDASGIPTSGRHNMGASDNYAVIPTATGVYTYTIQGTNLAGVSTSKTFEVTVQ
jgi:hypothetical protein